MFILKPSQYKITISRDKGRCVIATSPLPPGTVIGDYIGEVVRPEEDSDEVVGLYGMSAHDKYVFLPDIPTTGIHCINHSCMPNSAIYPYKNHVIFATLRQIFPGEELTVSYMVEPPDGLTGPQYSCRCHTPLCRGTMIISHHKSHSFWYKYIKNSMGKYYDNLDIPYHQTLPVLDKYPKSVRDHRIYDLFGSLSVPPAMDANASKVPSLTDLRKKIRVTGRAQMFPKLNLKVIGIIDNLIISSRLS